MLYFKRAVRSGIAKATAFFVLMSLANALTWANQSAEPYQFAYRYSPAGKLLGEIAASPHGGGDFPAKRYVYDSQRPGLKIAVEHGVLAKWQDETVAPKDWSGFSISHKERITYDAYGRVATTGVAGADNVYRTLTQLSYNRVGLVECKAVRMDAAGLAPGQLPASACDLAREGDYGADRITQYTYDARRNLTSERRAVGTLWEQAYARYTYDGLLKTSVTDAGGNKSSFEYDPFNRLRTWYFPSKTVKGEASTTDYEQYGYDARDNRISWRKRDGQVIRYQYDPLNRVTLKDLPGGGTRDVYYRYELNGVEVHSRFASHTGSGTVRRYSGFGELLEEKNHVDGKWYSVVHEYDAHGNRIRIVHPDSQAFDYHYDDLDRLVQVDENSANLLVSVNYDAYGRPTEMVTGGGALHQRRYDPAGRLSGMDHSFAVSASDLSVDFGYNPANQIVSKGLSTDRYHYPGLGGQSGSYKVNGLNQYTTVNSRAYTYDANGNVSNDGQRRYQYDVENRLTAAGEARLAYDPAGRLLSYTAGSTTTWFLWDGDALIAEYRNGAVTNRYVHDSALGIPIAAYEGPYVNDMRRLFYHKDHQGSVIAISDRTGNARYSNRYDAYGVANENHRGRFGYTGQLYLPELGLYHYRARAYDPVIGRFLQTDPVGYEDQVNLYAYVGNDPVNMVDPTGKVGQVIVPLVVVACAASKCQQSLAESIGAATELAAGDAKSRSSAKRRAARAAQRKKENPRVATSQSGRNMQGNKYGETNLRGQVKTGMDGKTAIGIQDGSRDKSNGPDHPPAVDVGNLKQGEQPGANGQPRIQNEHKVKEEIK